MQLVLHPSGVLKLDDYHREQLIPSPVSDLVEVIEHVDLCRLGALERVVFEFARPRAVVVTTPNAEYNVRFEGLPAGRFRLSASTEDGRRARATVEIQAGKEGRVEIRLR